MNATAERKEISVLPENHDKPASNAMIKALIFMGYDNADKQNLTMKQAEDCLKEIIEEQPERWEQWRSIRQAEAITRAEARAAKKAETQTSVKVEISNMRVFHEVSHPDTTPTRGQAAYLKKHGLSASTKGEANRVIFRHRFPEAAAAQNI